MFSYLRGWEEARQELESVIALQPGSAEAHHLAARVAITAYDDLRDPSLLAVATAHLKLARALAPKDADVAVTGAFLVYLRGQHEDAIAAYGAAIAMQPDHAFALGQRAMLHAAKGRLDLALEDYDQAIRSAPQDVVLRHGRADVLIALERPSPALEDLTMIIQSDPRDFLAYVKRAGVHRRLGRLEAALADLTTLIAGPNGAMPFATAGDQLAGFFMQRAMVLSDLRRNAEAARDMLQSVQLGGKSKILRLQVYLRQHGHPDVALDGVASGELATAVEACFAKQQCRAGLTREA